MKKFLKNSSICVLALIFVFTPLTSSLFFKDAKAETVGTKEQIEEAKKELDRIIKEQEEVQNSITQEQNNQEQLKSDAEYIKSAIKEKELAVKAVELEIQKIQAEISLKTEEKKDIEKKLKVIQDQKKLIEEDFLNGINLLYKTSFDTPTFLDERANFEDSIIESEKQKALVSMIDQTSNEVAALEKDAKSKQKEILNKENELSQKKSENLAENNNLVLQKQGLEWQQQNKSTLTKESLQKQQDLEQRSEELKQMVAEQKAKYDQLLVQKVSGPKPQPNSGNRVKAGDIIGSQGRTGYVCGYIPDISQIPVEDYKDSYKYCSPPLYFLNDVNKYPTIGSHLHFSYQVDGVWVDPSGYYGTFVHPPESPLHLTQGYSGGHTANDMDSGHGSPIYAIKDGVISYFCDNYIPGNPGFGASIHHDDGTVSLYWHMQGGC